MASLLDLLQLATYEWVRLPYGQKKKIATKYHIHEKMDWTKFCAFCLILFLLLQPDIIAYPFVFCKMLQWQMNFRNIMAFSENLLSYKRRYFILYIEIFLKGQLSRWNQGESLFSKISNMTFKSCAHCSFLGEGFPISAHMHNLLSL